MLLLIFLFGILFCFYMLLRNNLIYRYRIKQIDIIGSKIEERIYKHATNHQEIREAYKLVEKPSHEEMLFKFWRFDFDNMTNTENRLEEIFKRNDEDKLKLIK